MLGKECGPQHVLLPEGMAPHAKPQDMRKGSCCHSLRRKELRLPSVGGDGRSYRPHEVWMKDLPFDERNPKLTPELMGVGMEPPMEARS